MDLMDPLDRRPLKWSHTSSRDPLMTYMTDLQDMTDT